MRAPLPLWRTACWRTQLHEATRRFISSSAPRLLRGIKDIPGPRGLPVVGNLLQLAKGATVYGTKSVWYQNYLKYGPIYKMKGLFGTPMVVVSDPIGIEQTYRAEGEYPVRGFFDMSWIHEKNELPPSIGFVSGEEWKRLRKGISKQVLPKRLTNFAGPLSDITDDFLEFMVSIQNEDNTVVDTVEAVTKLVNVALIYMLAREQLDFDDPVPAEIQQSIFDVMGAAGKLLSSPPVYKILPTKPYKDYVKHMKHARDLARPFYQKRYNQLKNELEAGTIEVDETEDTCLIDQWLIEQKLSGKEIEMLAVELLVGAVDMMRNTATAMMHELAKNPEVQEKVYQEIRAVMGERSKVTYDDIQKLPLVRNTLKETLRLYLSPINSRVVDRDAEIMGYLIPAKTVVLLHVLAPGLNPQYFEDPLTFNPDRWNRDISSRVVPFAAIPFGFGIRNCYGQRIAEILLHTFITKLLQRFRLSTTQENIHVGVTLGLKLVKPVEIKLMERV